MKQETKAKTKKIVTTVLGIAVGACAAVAVDVAIKKFCPGLDEELKGPKKVMAKIGVTAASAALVTAISSSVTKEAEEITDSVIQTIEKAQETIAEVKNLEEAE